jgi:hypothetical protein
MPIRSDLRGFYKPPTWPAVRRRILERAGGKFNAQGKYLWGARCEHCKVPDGERVERGPEGIWRSLMAAIGRPYRNARGNVTSFQPCDSARRVVTIVLTVAHLNHVAGDDRDENLKALCQWCHLHYDAEHHKESRSLRKDKGRPLL